MAKKKITQNVNKDKFFNDLPEVHPQKSTWGTRWTNYQAANLGQIIPIYYDEVLPSERRKITLGMISHTTTPVAPIFPAMYTEVRAFFVPMRLAADLLNGYKDRKSPWVKVFGEDPASTSAGVVVNLTDQKLPDVSAYFSNAAAGYVSNQSNKDNIFNSLDLDGVAAYTKPNYLNIAAYELIYQRHYRNENYEAATDSDLYKFLFNAYNVGSGVSGLSTNFLFEIANREKDYFTGSKPYTLKANNPIKVSLTEDAQVYWKGDTTAGGTSDLPVLAVNESYDPAKVRSGFSLEAEGDTYTGKMFANLTSVQGISIEELRLLIKTQELLEKDAIWGSLYAESLNAHFGCCPLDLTLQDPQELYRTTITSNMQAIFQTSSTSGESSILGTIGANSTTQTDPFVILPETEFKEHGILMICAVHKLQNVYDSRYFKPKFIYKKARFDFFTPELNDMGYQSITDDEMRTGSGVVAFNEAFAEYRFKFNKCHGSLNVDFPYWAPAIANEYASIPAMYKEGTEILDKALSINSSTAPQFYDAWGFEEVNTKPMSLHSIPGFDGVI